MDGRREDVKRKLQLAAPLLKNETGNTRGEKRRLRRVSKPHGSRFFWTDDIIAYLAEHNISPKDFERVVMHPVDRDKSESSGRDAAFGYTQDGRFIIAVFEYLDEMTILPVTAYEVPEPR